MRKKIFLWVTIALIVLILILGFENITTTQSFLLLFYTAELSQTLVVFLSSLLGFLVGFFAMLYAYEKGREREMEEEDNAVAAAPATTAEHTMKSEPEQKPVDKFDEDDEILE